MSKYRIGLHVAWARIQHLFETCPFLVHVFPLFVSIVYYLTPYLKGFLEWKNWLKNFFARSSQVVMEFGGSECNALQFLTLSMEHGKPHIVQWDTNWDDVFVISTKVLRWIWGSSLGRQVNCPLEWRIGTMHFFSSNLPLVEVSIY